jgi:hypothetical protein
MLLDRGLAGDRQEARRLLSDALGDYSSIRMPLHIEIIETLLSKI